MINESNPGLIVLGTCGHPAVRELLAGSTFERVICLRSQLVLAVPHQEKTG